ncbi:Swt1 family HEPN domain-containing protein [Actinomyces sp. F1_1611]
MAMNNRDRVGKELDLLSEGLLDEVDEVMTRAYQTSDWPAVWAREDAQRWGGSPRTYTKHDVQVQLRALTEHRPHFKDVLSHAQQGFASELCETRNLWAHNEPFSSDDAARALDTIERLLHAVDAVVSAAEFAADLHLVHTGQTTSPEYGDPVEFFT